MSASSSPERRRRRGRRLGVGALWLCSALMCALVGWWAGRAATHPPQVQTQSTTPELVGLTRGTVSVAQDYVVQATWPSAPVGANAMSGTLTSLAVQAAGTSVKPGTVAYTVNLAPVVVMRGQIPAFRALGKGAKGPDVQQLQQFFAETGRLSKTQVSGSFDVVTSQAVKDWSVSLGLPASGTVPLGRVMFLPTMPAMLAPATDVRVGMQVTPGTPILVGASGQPGFTFRVLPEAVGSTRVGMAVQISPTGHRWQAQVRGLAAATDGSGGTVATLAPMPGQASICGSDCAGLVPVGATASLPARLVQVAPTSGWQVPTSAVLSAPSGDTCVVLADSTTRRVQVKASAQGRSIVTGLDPTTQVVVNPSGTPSC